MGGKRSLSGQSADATESSTLAEDAQEIIKNNLDLMLDVVMRIREDPDFASSIYEDCPRLQHQLELRPDLRPIFEDPHLVRINFEQVYREAGGKLPEDEEEEKKAGCMKKALAKVVNHPLFKVLRFLLLIKKIVGCVTGGGFAMMRGCFTNMCQSCSGPPDVDGADGGDGGADGGDVSGNPANAANKVALNKAAEYMEDPEVQEQIADLLESDPEALQEAIDQDPELSALRDANPLCAELMSHPDTMRILVDPDNLRALGECPDLIEADFADPDWMPPDVEGGGTASAAISATGADYAAVEVAHTALDGAAEGAYDGPGDFDLSAEFEDSGDIQGDNYQYDEFENSMEDFDEENPEEEEGVPEELELEEEDEQGQDGNALDDYEMGDANDQNVNKAGGRSGGNRSKSNNNRNQGGGIRGFMGQVGAGLTDLVAAELVGGTVGDFLPGGDGLDGLQDMADDAAGAADGAGDAANAMNDNAMAATSAMNTMDMLAGDDMMDNLDNLDKLEDGMDNLEDKNEVGGDGDNRTPGGKAADFAGGAAIGGAVAGGVGVPPGVRTDGEESEEEEVEEKKGRFGWLGDMASAVKTAAKETLVGAVLGDDLAEYLVEKQEEKAEENEQGEGAEEDEKPEGGQQAVEQEVSQKR